MQRQRDNSIKHPFVCFLKRELNTCMPTTKLVYLSLSMANKIEKIREINWAFGS